MSELRYTTTKPTEPGWYWCRNAVDWPGRLWEAIVYVARGGTIGFEGVAPDGLVASWISSPGHVGILHECEWADDCEWAGPICRPVNTDVFRGQSVVTHHPPLASRRTTW